MERFWSRPKTGKANNKKIRKYPIISENFNFTLPLYLFNHQQTKSPPIKEGFLLVTPAGIRYEVFGLVC